MNDYEDFKWRMEEYIEERISEGLVYVHEKLEEEMYDLVAVAMKQRTGEWMSAEDAARMLNVTTRTLYNWAKSGVLPRYRLGGQCYWKYDDVITRLEASDESDTEATDKTKG